VVGVEAQPNELKDSWNKKMNTWSPTKIIRQPSAALVMLAPPLMRGAIEARAEQVSVAGG
jgi:hypothetical protein